ncbi:MAG: hypothetical protein A2Y38_23480 [Spirochaetes bacterium GWB1_59_5]|nr:MAG: hypothetical protein A2Y38_23480 [Spirochaetes bacterium GWB1_59_5]
MLSESFWDDGEGYVNYHGQEWWEILTGEEPPKPLTVYESTHLMTDKQWAQVCKDRKYDDESCEHCDGCHAQRTNRSPTETDSENVTDPTTGEVATCSPYRVLWWSRQSLCSGPKGQPHLETVVAPVTRCPICRTIGIPRHHLQEAGDRVPWYCEGPRNAPHPEVLVPIHGLCPVCRKGRG